MSGICSELMALFQESAQVQKFAARWKISEINRKQLFFSIMNVDANQSLSNETLSME